VRDRGCMEKRLTLGEVGYEISKERRELSKLAAGRQRHGFGPPSRPTGVAQPIRRIERSIDGARTARPVRHHFREHRRLNCDFDLEASEAIVDQAAAAAVS